MTTETAASVSTLLTDLADAQRDGSADRLGALLTDDFRLVGPLGYVVDRDAWLDQYRAGNLKHTAFELREPQVRVHDSSAVAIANQVQTSAYQGNDASGAFRVTVMAVRQGDRWKAAGMHLSPMPPASPPQR